MEKLHTCAQLIEYINDVGFLPLLNIGIEGVERRRRYG